MNKILEYVEIAKQEGGRVLCGGERATEGELAKGAFLKRRSSRCRTTPAALPRKRFSGPWPWSSSSKTSKRSSTWPTIPCTAWAAPSGRATSTALPRRAGRQDRAHVVNTYNQIPSGAPFGGYKESGIGRETHKVMLEHYTQTKNIMINLGEEPSGFYPAK